MEKHTNFDEMFNDNDYVSQEEREQITFQVELIGKNIEAKPKIDRLCKEEGINIRKKQ